MKDGDRIQAINGAINEYCGRQMIICPSLTYYDTASSQV